MILSVGGGVFVNNGANVEKEYNTDGRRIILSPSYNKLVDISHIKLAQNHPNGVLISEQDMFQIHLMGKQLGQETLV